jgi:Haem-NO-binding
MHGLVNRAVQCFLRDTYGYDLWLRVARDAGVPPAGLETMAVYDLSVTEGLLVAAARHLNRPREAVLEDMGTYLVSHRTVEALRRLLRFGGVTFTDFLLSLEDLPDRTRMALPDLVLPRMALDEDGPDLFRLTVQSPVDGAGHVLMGLLRAMADDFGALVLLDHAGVVDGADVLRINLLDGSFAEGRSFDLASNIGRVA